jgi:hypothetical protein
MQGGLRAVEKKQLPHLLCVTNMLHNIKDPSFVCHDNTTCRPRPNGGAAQSVTAASRTTSPGESRSMSSRPCGYNLDFKNSHVVADKHGDRRNCWRSWKKPSVRRRGCAIS